MAQFTTLTSRVVPLPINDIDTDQIIPAQFLKVTDKNGLASALFYNWRYLADGSPNPDFVLNLARNSTARRFCWLVITSAALLARTCPLGADRLRLPRRHQHLVCRYFPQQCPQERLAAGHCRPAHHKALSNWSKKPPRAELTIDLASQTLSFPGGSVTFPIDPFNKTCLLNGVDELGYILGSRRKSQRLRAMQNGECRRFCIPHSAFFILHSTFCIPLQHSAFCRDELMTFIQIYDTTLRDGHAGRRVQPFGQ